MTQARGGKLSLDVILNLVGSVVRVGAMMFIVRQAGELFPAAGLGIFLLSRRLGSTWANLFQAGVSQTLIRYVAMHAADPAAKRRYVLTAVAYWAGLSALLIPACYLLRQPLSNWLLPEAADDGATAFWTGMFLLGIVADFILYSTLLAERRIVLANLLEFFNVSGLLLALFFFHDVELTPLYTLRVQSLGMIGLSLAGLAAYLALSRGWAGKQDYRPAVVRDFVSYGLPRAPGPFLEMGLTLLGPWLLRDHLNEAGYLLVALTFVRVVEMFVQPVVLVSSVVAARLLGAGDRTSLANGTRLLFGAVLTTAALTLATIAPFRDQLLILWLGDPVLAARVGVYATVLLWGLVPYTIFQGLKGIIEMQWVRPVNLAILAMGLAIQLGGYYAAKLLGVDPFSAVRLALLVSFFGLGLASTAWMRPTLAPFRCYGPRRLALVSLGLYGLNQSLVPLTPNPFLALVIMGVTGALALGALFVFPSPILREMWAFRTGRSGV